MNGGLDWGRDGQTWPNHQASRFANAGGVRFHVQVAGSGPALLLIHGTGASTHSWRDVLPRLASRFTVIAPDLPGHGFSSRPNRAGMSLPGMADSVGALLATLNRAPTLAVGHSAGAAILSRMILDRRIAPATLVAVNGALLPLRGPVTQFFSPLAKLLAANPLVPRLFAWRAGDIGMARKLIAETGSTLDETGLALYARLMRGADHAAGALSMMANWDLFPLARELPRLPVPLLLIAGERDRTIPPAEQARIAALVPSARLVTMPGLGHLAHEERPDEFVALLTSAGATESGVAA